MEQSFIEQVRNNEDAILKLQVPRIESLEE